MASPCEIDHDNHFTNEKNRGLGMYFSKDTVLYELLKFHPMSI